MGSMGIRNWEEKRREKWLTREVEGSWKMRLKGLILSGPPELAKLCRHRTGKYLVF